MVDFKILEKNIETDRRIELVHPEIDEIRQLCNFCNDPNYLPDIKIALQQ